jgi:hypothetical protein
MPQVGLNVRPLFAVALGRWLDKDRLAAELETLYGTILDGFAPRRPPRFLITSGAAVHFALESGLSSTRYMLDCHRHFFCGRRVNPLDDAGDGRARSEKIQPVLHSCLGVRQGR